LGGRKGWTTRAREASERRSLSTISPFTPINQTRLDRIREPTTSVVVNWTARGKRASETCLRRVKCIHYYGVNWVCGWLCLYAWTFEYTATSSTYLNFSLTRRAPLRSLRRKTTANPETSYTDKWLESNQESYIV
jgi:hypothetical protein